MKNTAFAIIILLAVVRAASAASTPSWWLLNQKVTVSDVTATVGVYPMGRNEFNIQASFESSRFPVGCLSAYRDLQYKLLDANSRIVPVSQQTLEHPPCNGQWVNHAVTGATAHPCSSNAPTGVWNEIARLSALYPNLPPGRYTLRISFAPRGIGQQADFTPVQISIEPLT
jgi:hypothetical protein